MFAAEVKVALAGIAGYGNEYLESLLRDPRAAMTNFVGVVDPSPQRCKHLDELHRRRIPIFATLEELFAASPVELMMIATPIHLHASQTCFALSRGASVLCEKPLAASLTDAAQMAECERRAQGRFVAIGYQWSFSEAVQSLKRDIIAGVFGRAVRMKSIAFFPRGYAYFARNGWAGRIRTSSGEDVLDSPANNATAHYLHNMLYLLGQSRESSAMPASVQAELYRANRIENYDTVALRAMLPSGAELLFYSTHAVEHRLGPRCELEFENATIKYDFLNQPTFIARFKDGRVENYGDPNADRTRKIWQSVDSVRSGARPACGIRAAMPHTVTVVAAQQSAPTIADFSQSLRRTLGENCDSIVCIEGLAEGLTDCYRRTILPAEHGGLPWARAGKPVDCTGQMESSFPPNRVSVTIPSRPGGVYAG